MLQQLLLDQVPGARCDAAAAAAAFVVVSRRRAISAAIGCDVSPRRAVSGARKYVGGGTWHAG